MIKVILTQVMFMSILGFAISAEWSYDGEHGPDKWGDTYNICKSGMHQSPIALDAKDATYNASKKLDTLEFRNYDLKINGTIKNNGHTIQVDLDPTSGTYPYLQSGGLTGSYRALQLHFHWGNGSTEGSEHSIAKKHYPLELHIVHFKEEYESLANASNYFDGLAVVGFVYEVSANPNIKFSQLSQVIPDVKYEDAEMPFRDFSLLDMTHSNLKTNSTGQPLTFFRYHGGLTTPPCSMIVQWTVMTDPVYINSEQLGVFHDIYEGNNSTGKMLTANFRPLQSINNRKIYISFKEVVKPESTTEVNQKDSTEMNAATTILSINCLIFLVLFQLF